MERTTRPISSLTERSRFGVPICPRKYFEATTLVAICDQNLGNSTSRCSKTTWPFSFEMTAVRRSHSTSSNGFAPARVNTRGKRRPPFFSTPKSGLPWTLIPVCPSMIAMPLVASSLSIACPSPWCNAHPWPLSQPYRPDRERSALPKEQGLHTTAGGEQAVKKKHKMLGHREIVPQSIDVEKGLGVRVPGFPGAFFGFLTGPFLIGNRGELSSAKLRICRAR